MQWVLEIGGISDLVIDAVMITGMLYVGGRELCSKDKEIKAESP